LLFLGNKKPSLFWAGLNSRIKVSALLRKQTFQELARARLVLNRVLKQTLGKTALFSL
jgi:hypothetical protein